MILTKWQAEAAYSAICAISAVGGTVRIEIEPAKTADKLTVSMCGGSIFVFKYKELGMLLQVVRVTPTCMNSPPPTTCSTDSLAARRVRAFRFHNQE